MCSLVVQCSPNRCELFVALLLVCVCCFFIVNGRVHQLAPRDVAAAAADAQGLVSKGLLAWSALVLAHRGQHRFQIFDGHHEHAI